MRDAIVEGFRYVRGAPEVRSVLIRTGAFSVGAASLLALLPVVCQPHGAQGYGFLLTCFGLGALSGAALLPRLRLRYSVDGLVAGATVVFAAMTFLAGQVHVFEWLCLVLFTAGAAWIGILACFNVVAQTMCPSWMRARALSMYLLVSAGWNGRGQRGLGMAGRATGRAGGVGVVGLGDDRWAGEHPAASFDGGGVEDGSGGGERLSVRRRQIKKQEYGPRMTKDWDWLVRFAGADHDGGGTGGQAEGGTSHGDRGVGSHRPEYGARIRSRGRGHAGR